MTMTPFLEGNETLGSNNGNSKQNLRCHRLPYWRPDAQGNPSVREISTWVLPEQDRESGPSGTPLGPTRVTTFGGKLPWLVTALKWGELIAFPKQSL